MLQRLLAFLLMAMAGPVTLGQTIDAGWRVVAGEDPLVQTAAKDLQALLAEEHGIAVAPSAAVPADATGRMLIIGTPGDNALIARAHAEKPFKIDPAEPEAYHLALRNGSVYVVGAAAKGAMNGAFRLLDRGTLDVAGLDESAAPVFRHRAGGHKVNQSPPADWTDMDQARFMARHYLNIVWGEKHGPPMPLEARQAYGLRLMVEMKFPPFLGNSRDYMDDPKYASAVYYHKGDEGRRVLDPFDDVGRQVYLDSYAELLKTNPDTAILYALFGDYSVIPSPDSRRASDGKTYAHTRIETMQQVMGIMREALAAAGIDDAVAVAWLWHGFFGEPKGAEQEFMAWLRDNGYGILYNEAGNNDNWLIKRDNFAEAALRKGDDGKVEWGENYYPLVSVGGACESVNPVIAMPLPFVAAHKLNRMVDAGVKNAVLWWGSAEGWAYSPNLEVLARVIWEPQAAARPDELLREIAARDFGEEFAAEMVDYWQTFDRALVTDGALYRGVDDQAPPDEDGLHINDWYQRMGIFTETVFSQEFARPLTRESLAGHKSAGQGTYWGTHAKTLANYAHVLEGLGAAQAKLKALIDADQMAPAAQERARQTYRWAELYRTLLTSQHNYLRALRAVHGRKDEPVELQEIDARLKPVIADELANIDQMIAVLQQLPANANIRQPHEGAVSDRGSTAQEIASLREKAAAMKFAGTDRRNVALDRPATASSVKTEDGQTFEASFATDGDRSTRWASIFRDEEWLAVDLGETRSIEVVRIAWKNAYPSDYEIQVAQEASPEQWRTVHHTTSGGGGESLITLDEPVPARHVRMKANKQATAWGYSIEEFEVFGE